MNRILPPARLRPAPDTRIAKNVLDLIGSTPLLHLSRYLDRDDVTLLAKVEALNPGGSAKDRPAQHMIEEALRKGALKPGDTVVESSSGNMGIGLAQACAWHGLRFICVVDPNAQRQNVAIIRALGGRIELVDHAPDGDFLRARLARVDALLKEDPARFWPNQYANLDNPASHARGTVAEIDSALEGRFQHLFVACSSTGTARGCRDYLHAQGRDTKVVAVDAEGSTLFNGKAGPRKISGMGAGKLPDLAKGQAFDGLERVSDATCVAGCRRAAAREGLLVGGSAGGVLEAVRRRQDRLAGQTVVAILHDSGARYTETVFNADWVESTLGLSEDAILRLAGLAD